LGDGKEPGDLVERFGRLMVRKMYFDEK